MNPVVNRLLRVTGELIASQFHNRRRGRQAAAQPRSGSGRHSTTTEFTGDFLVSYAPHPGPTPDPGEVVWVWVPYEEDHAQGKTRPVLLLGRQGKDFISVFFSSVDHDLDEAQEAHEGRYWVKVGRGSWDRQGRVSYAQVDRLLRTPPQAIDGRAEVLDRPRFDAVVAGVAARA